ncbi:MAG: hypothetical protein R6W94_08635 [Spirochaetia bacterium]
MLIKHLFEAVECSPIECAVRFHLKERLGEHAAHIASVQERADEILESLRRAVNARVSRHSRLSRMVLEWEPFEKTPTRKIKRFLYTHLGDREGRRA